MSGETEQALNAAQKAVREARRLHIMDQRKAKIERWGQCPMDWGHADWDSVIAIGIVMFTVGLIIGIVISYVSGCR